MTTSTNWNTQKVKTLKKQWATLTSGRNTSDHALATWAQRTMTALAEGEFTEFCTSRDGLDLHVNTSRQYERMSRALEKVPESDAWKAVGWSGVRLLCRIEKKKERAAIARWIMSRAKKTVVTESALETRIDGKAPSYKPVGGGGNSGSGGPTKKALKTQNEKLSAEVDTLSHKHEQLVADVTKVIAKYPIIKNDLSAATIADLGLTGGQLPKVKSA